MSKALKTEVRVLLVEDDKDDFLLIRALLASVRSTRYKVTWASDHSKALKQIRGGRHDVCLMDYRLGVKSGLDILRELSGNAEILPIIFLTGYGDYKVDMEAMKAGAADFIVKDQIDEKILDRSIRYAMERKRTENALRESKRQLDYLSAQLLRVQEIERRKVAAELHDNLGQILTAIKYGLENVLSRIPEDLDLMDELQRAVPLIQGALEQVRSMYTGLRPSLIDDLGIKATLNWYSREFENANSGIQLEREISVEEDRIGEDLKLAIFRIVQDAMDNVAIHSRARRAKLSLSMGNGNLCLEIRDDGEGFDFDAMVSQTESDSGLGLRSIQKRAELTGGRLNVESDAVGTSVRIIWPI